MRRPSKWGLCHLLAALMIFDPYAIEAGLSVRNSGQQQCDAPETQTKGGAPAKLSAEELKGMTADMDRAFEGLEAAAKEIRRETFDVRAIINSAGDDPAKLFEWVRDNTYWVPYQGALRGPTGVLMDRLGSSLDRSLLLAELLRAAGHRVRLARAELPEDQAKSLLPKLRAVSKPPIPQQPAATGQEMETLIEKYAKDYKFDAAVLRRNLNSNEKLESKLAQEVAQRVADQTPRIVAALGKPDEKQAKALRDRDAQAALSALRDHWWVERHDGNNWVPLDPLLPGSAPGKASTDARETIEFEKAGAAALDAKFCHLLKINVVIEQWNKTGPTEKRVLGHTLRPSEVFGKPITLRSIPMGWPRGFNLLEEKEPLTKLKSLMTKESEWLPILSVGSINIAQSSFTDQGETDANAPARLKSLFDAKALGGGVASILGSGKIGAAKSGPKRTKDDAELTAVWMEYEIHSPGETPRVIRRPILDLVGADARQKKSPLRPVDEGQRLHRALVLSGVSEILPVPCRLSRDFVDHTLVSSLVAQRRALSDMLRYGAGDESKKGPLQTNVLSVQPYLLYFLALRRQEWMDALTYPASPNVFCFHARLELSPKGEIALCRGHDIVANDVAVAPAVGIDPFLVRVRQGVLDTNAEGRLSPRCWATHNAGIQMAASPKDWIAVRRAEDLDGAGIEAPPAKIAELRAALAAGYVVFAPKRALTTDGRSSFQFWRVDPRTGTTLGIGERGWGEGSVEYLGMTEEAWIALIVSVGALVTLVFCGQSIQGSQRRAVRCALLFLVSMVAVGLTTGRIGLAVTGASTAASAADEQRDVQNYFGQ